jgi:hypothetical protein
MKSDIENAKDLLKANGYQTYNLWHVDDVMLRYECNLDEAMDIIEQALTNEWVIEQVFYVVGSLASEYGLKRKEE